MHFARSLIVISIVALALATFSNRAAAEEMPLPRAEPERVESRTAYAERIAIIAGIGGALFVGGWFGSWLGALNEGEPEVCVFGGGYTGLVNSGRCSGGPTGDAVGLSFIPLFGSFATVGADRIDDGRAMLTGLLQVAGVLTLAIGLPLAITSRQASSVTVSISPNGLGLSGSF